MGVKNSNLIRLSKSSLSVHEQLEVIKTLDSEFLGYGEVTKRFEDKLSEFFGMNSISVNSGNTALILSLQIAGIKNGDIVLVPSFTYLATVQSITALGAIPYFWDVTAGHLSIDDIPSDLLIAKAIIFVHYGGVEIDMKI